MNRKRKAGAGDAMPNEFAADGLARVGWLMLPTAFLSPREIKVA